MYLQFQCHLVGVKKEVKAKLQLFQYQDQQYHFKSNCTTYLADSTFWNTRLVGRSKTAEEQKFSIIWFLEIAIQILRESKKLNTTVNNASSKVSSKAYVG